MTAAPPLTVVRFTPGSPADARKGLLGWAVVRYGDLHVDGIALRRTRGGRHVLSFPVRHDRAGSQHDVVRPVDDAARGRIEAAVLAALGLHAAEPAP